MKLKPSVELPDETPLKEVSLPTRIQNALAFYGIKTIGEVRTTPEATLLAFQDLGHKSIAYLREHLGLPIS
jgi:DNA-directed RNA polymerase alpha subunit